MSLQYNVTMVKVADLVNSSYNPRIRTERGNLKKLKDAIVQAGGILVPILITKDLEIIDGHRRVAAAIDLGMEEVPALIRDKKEETWMLTNVGTRAMTPPEMMQAYHNGYPIKLIPHIIRNRIITLERISGPDLFSALCERGVSPTVLGNVTRVTHYCDQNNDDFRHKVLVWFETHHQQWSARKFMDANQSIDVLMDAVNNNRPLIFKWT